MKHIVPMILVLMLIAGCAAPGTDNGQADKAPLVPVSRAADSPAEGAIFAMDTYMEFRIYGDEALLGEAVDIIGGMEAALSVTYEKSEIYAVNRDGFGTVSDTTAALISRALTLCGRTDGALDISVYPIVRAWGFTTGDYRVPPDEELAALLENVDYTRVSLTENTVTLADGMMIDLGSVAKGAASGAVVDYLRSQGVTSALLNLGGNVHTLGTKPDGSLWHIAVKDPVGAGNLCVLDIADKAVITSGGYERFFEEDGVTYWHIIDPATGTPARNGLISVTVVGEDGLLCDALSTSLFVMGPERAAQLWRESDDFEAVFVMEDGSVAITEGLEGSFRLLDAYENADYEVIRRG